jgi:hypothetical protein
MVVVSRRALCWWDLVPETAWQKVHMALPVLRRG